MAENIQTAEATWVSCDVALPADGELVDTKIDDADGCRNEQTLTRHGRLWFLPGAGVYVYYTPTHWRKTQSRP
jgi:hypothetical protein